MFKVINHYKKFIQLGKEFNIQTSIPMYIVSIGIRLKYGVGSKDFFENRLYDRNVSHKEYYETVHYVIHKWDTVSRKFMPNSSVFYRMKLYLDYKFSQIIYPGLDAMDYFRYEFYSIRHNKRKEYITEGAMKKMDTKFNGSSLCVDVNERLSNKQEFNKMFSDIVTRKWLITDECTENEFFLLCENENKLIVKPLCEGGGKGIFTVEITDDNSKRMLFSELSCNHFIIEEIIVQHPELACINPPSVNTVRIYTVADKQGGIHVTGATLRMGNGIGPTDNYSRGGLAAEIDIDLGVVVSRAVSQNADSVIIHPYSGEIILGKKIPKWKEMKDLVIKAHKRVLPLRYIGWDVVVCEDGQITLLEANTCAGVELQQHPGLIGKKSIYKKYM